MCIRDSSKDQPLSKTSPSSLHPLVRAANRSFQTCTEEGRPLFRRRARSLQHRARAARSFRRLHGFGGRLLRRA
eukprot:6135294-Pyramimonas_sp.AAC.1